MILSCDSMINNLFSIILKYGPNMSTSNRESNLKTRMSEWSFSAEQSLLTLPMDKQKSNFVRREVPGAVFSETFPTPFKSKSKLVAVRYLIMFFFC